MVKKGKLANLCIAFIAAASLLAGCSTATSGGVSTGNTSTSTSGSAPTDDPVIIEKIETSIKDYTEELPEGYIAPDIPAEPQFDDTGDVTVTRVYQGARTDFLFTEDYEWFAKEGECWTLDLNGNTVIVDETIHLSSKVTITNGTLVIKAAPGFVCENNVDQLLTFSGEDKGPLKIFVSSGATCAYVHGNTIFRKVDMDIYGVGVMIDTFAGEDDPDGMRTCCFVDSNVNVYGGAAVINPTNEKAVRAGVMNWSTGTSTLTVYAGGIGIDNSGLFAENTYSFFEEINVQDGCGIYNHEDSMYYATYGNSKITVDGGIGVVNEGYCKFELYAEVKQGVAIYNKGVADFYTYTYIYTVPTELFTGTLVYNDVDAEINFSHLEFAVYTASKAIGIDNFGTITGNITMFGGTPNPYKSYQLDIYRRDHEEYAGFFEGSTNIFEKTQLFVSEQGSHFDIQDVEIFLNSTDSSPTSWDDTSIGFYNKSSLAASLLGYLTVNLQGEGGIGFINTQGAFVSPKVDLYSPRIGISIINNIDYNLDDDVYRANYKTRMDAPKKCAGIINKGTLAGYERFSIGIYADDCVGIDNQGTFDSALEGLGYNRSVDMYAMVIGDNNFVLNNSEFIYSSGTVNLHVYGNNNTVIDSKKFLGGYEYLIHARGSNNKLMNLAGTSDIYRINLFVEENEYTDATKNATIFVNNGELLGKGFIELYAAEGEGGNVIFKNTETGKIDGEKVISLEHNKGKDNEIFYNSGTINVKQITVTSDEANDSTVFYNDGIIRAAIRVTVKPDYKLTEVSGLTGFVNKGTIYLGSLYTEIHRECCTTDYVQDGSYVIEKEPVDYGDGFKYGSVSVNVYDADGKAAYREANDKNDKSIIYRYVYGKVAE